MKKSIYFILFLVLSSVSSFADQAVLLNCTEFQPGVVGAMNRAFVVNQLEDGSLEIVLYSLDGRVESKDSGLVQLGSNKFFDRFGSDKDDDTQESTLSVARKSYSDGSFNASVTIKGSKVIQLNCVK